MNNSQLNRVKMKRGDLNSDSEGGYGGTVVSAITLIYQQHRGRNSPAVLQAVTFNADLLVLRTSQ